jgi:CHAT domain-containing protein/tetratricopeptide (TPR) repeat protein
MATEERALPEEGGAARVRSTLVPGEVYRSPLAAGESHRYRLMLAGDQFVDLRAEQQGVDLVLSLFAPDGSRLLLVDSPNGSHGPERLAVASRGAGEHLVELRSQDGQDRRGSYELEVLSLRPATPQDRTQAGAAASFAAAEELRRRGDRSALEGAIAAYDEALARYQELRSAAGRNGAAIALWRLGDVYRTLGRLDESMVCYERSLAFCAEMQDRRCQATLLNNVGLVYRQQGDLERALEHYRRALSMHRSTAHRQGEATTLNNLGQVCMVQGLFYQALEYYDAALALWQELENPSQRAVTFSNVGGVYSALHQGEMARDYFERSLQLMREIDNRRGEAVTLSNLGLLHSRQGDGDQALRRTGQALEIFELLGDRPGEMRTLLNLGWIHQQHGDGDQARRAYDGALELARRLEDRTAQADVLVNRGWLLDSLGDPAAALRDCAAATLPEGTPDPRRRATILYATASALRHQGRLAQAQAAIEAALEVVETLRAHIPSNELRSAFFATKHEQYEFYVDLLMERWRRQGSAAFAVQAFEASQRARARGFLDALEESRVSLRAGADAQMLAEEAALQAEINAAERQRLERAASGTTEELADAARRQRELLARLEKLRTRLRLSAARNLGWSEPLGLEEIQRRILDPETRLLHYELAAEKSFLWVVAPDSIASFELPGKAEIEAAARHAYSLLKLSHHRKHRGEAHRTAAALGEMLLGPAVAQLDARRLLIVGEGVLEYLPFAALRLRTADDEEPQPLVLDYEVVRLPAASVLASLRTRAATRPTGKLAVLADPVFDSKDPRVHRQRAEGPSPLPATVRGAADAAGLPTLRRLVASRHEAEAILALVPREARFEALDFAANRSAVTTGRLAGYEILHFATHGFLNSRQPELSGLVFSLVDEDGRPCDGFLRSHEIHSLELAAELVVLSACQTALGKEIEGEGLEGLTRAFMVAGARRVVVSLWQVHDRATAELMERFYRDMLTEGLAPAAALRSAQLAMVRDPRWQAPFYWAAFVLEGDWGSPRIGG